MEDNKNIVPPITDEDKSDLSIDNPSNEATPSQDLDSNKKEEKAKSEPTAKVKEKTNDAKKKGKSLVVNKEKNEPKDERLEAINRYKDVPIGTLYNDLNEMHEYVEILNQRRNELLNARAHVNPHVRREAIQRTIDNTYSIQFKYQDATFRDHYAPAGLRVVGQNIPNSNENPHYGNRVMPNSATRPISDASSYNTTTFSVPQFIYKDQPNNQGSVVRHHAGMERRDGRTIGDQQSFTMVNTFVPPPNDASRTIYNQGMENRNIAYPNQPMADPQQYYQQVPPPMMNPQQYIQQQTVTTQETIDYGIKPIRVIDKPVVQAAALDVWPLYQKIQLLLSHRKISKALLVFIVIFIILSMLVVIFFILWGFAIDWTGWDTKDIGEAFKNLFGR